MAQALICKTCNNAIPQTDIQAGLVHQIDEDFFCSICGQLNGAPMAKQKSGSNYEVLEEMEIFYTSNGGENGGNGNQQAPQAQPAQAQPAEQDVESVNVAGRKVYYQSSARNRSVPQPTNTTNESEPENKPVPARPSAKVSARKSSRNTKRITKRGEASKSSARGSRGGSQRGKTTSVRESRKGGDSRRRSSRAGSEKRGSGGSRRTATVSPRSGSSRRGGGSERRSSESQRGTRRLAPQNQGLPPAAIAGIAGGVVLFVVLLIFAFSGGSGSSRSGGSGGSGGIPKNKSGSYYEKKAQDHARKGNIKTALRYYEHASDAYAASGKDSAGMRCNLAWKSLREKAKLKDF